jgi:hypothetical protein
MITRLANIQRVARVTAMAAAFSAVGWGTGSAMAEAAPHVLPHPDVSSTSRGPAAIIHKAEASVVHEWKGTIFFHGGIPIGSILRGQENVGGVIDILTRCRAHEGNSHRTPDGFIFVHC